MGLGCLAKPTTEGLHPGRNRLYRMSVVVVLARCVQSPPDNTAHLGEGHVALRGSKRRTTILVRTAPDGSLCQSSSADGHGHAASHRSLESTFMCEVPADHPQHPD